MTPLLKVHRHALDNVSILKIYLDFSRDGSNYIYIGNVVLGDTAADGFLERVKPDVLYESRDRKSI